MKYLITCCSQLESIASKLTSDEISKKKIDKFGEIPLLEYIKKSISLISERINKMKMLIYTKNMKHLMIYVITNISKKCLNLKII